MKDRAVTYLMKNPLLHMEMIEAIRRGTADILYAEMDGVLLKEQKSNAYMVTADNFETGRKLIDNISECDLIVAHEKRMADYISDKFGLTERLECFQTAYMSKIKLDIKEELEIRQLNQDQAEVISEHYDKLSCDEILTLLKNGNLFGGYKGGTLVGFIGNHLEGSIGILEVFPQYRRLGYGTVLVGYMVNQMLEKDLMPFAQAEVDNEKSLSMQKKLGFSISNESLFWIY